MVVNVAEDLPAVLGMEDGVQMSGHVQTHDLQNREPQLRSSQRAIKKRKKKYTKKKKKLRSRRRESVRSTGVITPTRGGK